MHCFRHVPGAHRRLSPPSVGLDPSPSGCCVTTTRFNCADSQRLQRTNLKFSTAAWEVEWERVRQRQQQQHPPLCGGPQICACGRCGSAVDPSRRRYVSTIFIKFRYTSPLPDRAPNLRASRVPTEPCLPCGGAPPDHAARPQNFGSDGPAQRGGVPRGFWALLCLFFALRRHTAN